MTTWVRVSPLKSTPCQKVSTPNSTESFTVNLAASNSLVTDTDTATGTINDND